MTAEADSAAISALTLPSNYFYTATSSAASGTFSSSGSAYSGTVQAGGQAGISGTIGYLGSNYFSLTSSSGSSAQYQVVGSSADGQYLVFTDSHGLGINAPPYFILSNSGTPPVSGDIVYSSNNPYSQPVACFGAGTRIVTQLGEIAVESLRRGDLISTPSGLRPVRWVGHSIVHPPRSPNPREANPIRIRAHAFADGVPSRDLRVSPGHALLVGDVLINAGELVNGGTIVQEEATRVDYYHVELDSHDILIAEGMPCESYLDDGNRASFLNGADHVALHGRIDRASEATCRPLVKSGPLLVAARAMLLARAIEQGWELAEAPGLRLCIDGAEIAPIAEAGRSAWFLLPAGHDGRVRLRAAAAIVNRIAPELADGRRIGVAIGSLRVDGVDVPLDDAAFGAGCYAPEGDGHASWRWTDGDAALTLPAGARMIEVRLQIVLPTLQRGRVVGAVAAAA